MSPAAIGWLWNGYVVLLHATAFLLVAALLVPFARRDAAARARAYAAALVGMVVVTALCHLPIAWWAPVVPRLAAVPMLVLGGMATEAATDTPRGLWWAVALRALWLGGSAIVALRIAAAWWTMRAITRRAIPLTDRAWRGALREAASAHGARQDVLLVMSGEVHTPLTWGALDPVIVLPADASAWTAGERAAVLLHEMAHVHRADCLAYAVAQLAAVCYWFHPGVWWALRGLRRAREEASDALAVRGGIRASAYAESLLAVAARARVTAASRRIAPLAVGMADAPHLATRVRRVLTPMAVSPHRARRERRVRAVTRVAVAGGALFLGSVRISPHPRVLWDALGEPAWSTRAYAARLLARGRDTDSARLRARVLTDSHPAVRALARRIPALAR